MADTTSGATSLANRLRVSAIAREDRVQSAFSDGNDNTMWQSAWSMVASINNRVASSPSPIDPVLLDIDLHDLWHIYWHGAINTDDNSAKLDLLALQIIQLRDQGVLRYQTPGGAVEVTASNGRRLWTDLPFLVEDMMEHWTNNCAALSSDQRLSGAQFLANIAAAGAAADDALCGIALVVLRETLERPRPRSLLAPTDGDDKRGMGDLTIADLLPAANAWLFTAGYKLVMLSDSQWEGCSAEVGGFGELVSLFLQDSNCPPCLDAANYGVRAAHPRTIDVGVTTARGIQSPAMDLVATSP